jgi:hypothetical protein
MMVASFIILAITFIPIIASLWYFHKEKEACSKYPFLALRDKIVWEIITAGRNEQLQASYKRANLVSKKLKELNFGFLFFVETMATVFEKIIANEYKKALGGESIKLQCLENLNEFDKELTTLIMAAARKNSLTLRISMTKIGYHVLFFPVAGRTIYRLIKHHPNLFKKQRSKIKIIQKYAVLAYCS